MAFAQKTDYSGLLATFSDALVIRDETPNNTNEVWQPTGQNGSVAEIETYGEDASPTNNFALKGVLEAAAGDVLINNIISVGNKSYAFEKLSINTSGGTAVSISAGSQMIETDVDEDEQYVYEVPAFTVSPEHAAQDIFGAFTLTGERCQLTQCNAEIGGSIGKDKVAGVIVYSDVGTGLITVTGTIFQLGTATPTITPQSGSNWVLTKAPVKTNPEASKPTWAFELRLPLTKVKLSTLLAARNAAV